MAERCAPNLIVRFLGRVAPDVPVAVVGARDKGVSHCTPGDASSCRRTDFGKT